MKKILLSLITFWVITTASFAQYPQPIGSPIVTCGYPSAFASITIVNRSDYTLTVKVMRQNGGLYQMVCLSPQSSRSVSFARSGSFYTKTKAEKSWSTTLYKKGGCFNVQCDETGYTTGTLEYFISSTGGGTMGKSISRSEFEQDYK